MRFYELHHFFDKNNCEEISNFFKTNKNLAKNISLKVNKWYINF